jgi:predicted HTH domain antitoxin
MTIISLELPDSLLDSYNQNIQTIINEAKQVFIISEYQKGHLSLQQSADALNLSYPHFLELLWSRGISMDALNKVKRLKRQAGLGSGKFWMSEDFDEPLPDEFWLGDE